MKKNIIFILILLVSIKLKAQLIKNRSIDTSIGYGVSFPHDDVNITGSGLYLQGEYAVALASWIDIRPYAGLILTKAGKFDENYMGPAFKTITNAFLIGGKTRIIAPIPWVAPYIEIGIGASIGSFETYTPYTELKNSGVIFHMPWSIGLELGPQRNFDIAFSYYEHPSMKQFSGALAVGYSFPLSTK